MSSYEYQLTLPKKRMGSGALFFNQQGEVLLVEPSYKPTWEIPGGVVEAHESPKSCCEREIAEELGLTLSVGRLLCVDYNGTTETRLESLMFIFDGGVLSQELIESIQIQADELVSFQFFGKEDLPPNLSDSLKERILASWANRLQDENLGSTYLEEGKM
ncbi:MAG: NUDIX domain-containing protein [Anaerolineae bacterium]